MLLFLIEIIITIILFGFLIYEKYKEKKPIIIVLIILFVFFFSVHIIYQKKRIGDVYVLEASARVGSRSDYERLLAISKRWWEFSARDVAKNLVQKIRNDFSPFQYHLLRIGGIEENLVQKFGHGLFKDWSTKKLFSYLEEPNNEVNYYRSLILYIKKKPRGEIVPECKRILKESDSFYTCVAICGMLKRIYGDKVDFMDFDGWLKYLESQKK